MNKEDIFIKRIKEVIGNANITDLETRLSAPGTSAMEGVMTVTWGAPAYHPRGWVCGCKPQCALVPEAEDDLPGSEPLPVADRVAAS